MGWPETGRQGQSQVTRGQFPAPASVLADPSRDLGGTCWGLLCRRNLTGYYSCPEERDRADLSFLLVRVHSDQAEGS